MGMLTIRVTPEQHRKVRLAAINSGVSMEAFVRDAIEHAMQQQPLANREVYFDKDEQKWAVRFNGEASTVVFHESKSVIEDLLDWVDGRVQQRGQANGKGQGQGHSFGG